MEVASSPYIIFHLFLVFLLALIMFNFSLPGGCPGATTFATLPRSMFGVRPCAVSAARKVYCETVSESFPCIDSGGR